MVHVRKALVATVLLLSVMAAAPAGAHDPEEAHTGPGAVGPTLVSDKMKPRATLARSADAVQSDFAFAGKLAYAGNFLGFRVLDISAPANPVQVADVRCNGPQGDVSVYGNLLFQSVDTPQTNPTCSSVNTTAATPGAWEGIRIFDVTNPAAPSHVASVRTDCGSHTHTLVPDRASDRVLV